MALSSAWPREADGAQMKLKRPPPDAATAEFQAIRSVILIMATTLPSL